MGTSLSMPEMESPETAEGSHEHSSENHNESKDEGFQTIDKDRWADLMYSLQSIAKLQRAATRARIDARQKMRGASFKREDVWIRDTKFMVEVQRLNALGKLKGFEELTRLADECQAARDLLGPLEQDTIEAEARWQGQIWKLKQAEEELYDEFGQEFAAAEEYVTTDGGEATTSHQPYSDADSSPSDDSIKENDHRQTDDTTFPVTEVPFPNTEEQIPPSLAYADTQEFEDVGSDLDSGIGDIDSILGISPLSDIKKHGQSRALPIFHHSRIEVYHGLLEDFSTQRERINKWLEHTALESRLEGISIYSILQDRLAVENQNVPSNWAQLVIAWWTLDGAAVLKADWKAVGHNDHVPIGHTKADKVDNKDRAEDQTSRATDVQTHTLPNELSTTNINSHVSEGGESTTIFNGKGLAPPTLIPPSPPISNGNSRSASRDTRTEDRPP